MTAKPDIRILAFLLLLSCMGITGCNSEAPKSGLPIVDMQVGSKKFKLEIAAKLEPRNKGMMFRDSLPDDRGMIFIFKDEQPLSFFMKNTRIPLDIIYLDHAGKVVSIKQMKPYLLDSVRSDGPAQYAIELNVNTASALGIKPGDTIAIPEIIRQTEADPIPEN